MHTTMSKTGDKSVGVDNGQWEDGMIFGRIHSVYVSRDLLSITDSVPSIAFLLRKKVGGISSWKETRPTR